MSQKTLTAMFDDLTPPIERTFFSVGGVCQLLQITPGQLRVLMDDLSLKFDRCVDAVPFVDGVQLELLVARRNEIVTNINKAVEGAKAAAPHN